MTNNYWKNRIDPKTGKQYKPTALVLHITDSSFQSAMGWFQDPHSNASSNWLIDTNGKWHMVVKESDAAWANGRLVNPTWKGIIEGVNPNLYTISVEVASTGGFPPWRQWISWAKGCKELLRRNGLTINDVVNHNEIHGGKTCPGTWFSKFYLKLLLTII